MSENQIRWKATFGNWRWWLLMPIMLPLAIIVIGILKPLNYVLWPIGQGICNFSNWCYNAKTPDWLVACHKWAFKNYV